MSCKKLFYVFSILSDLLYHGIKDQTILYNTIEIEPINEYKKLIIEQWKKEVGSKDEFNKFIKDRKYY